MKSILNIYFAWKLFIAQLSLETKHHLLKLNSSVLTILFHIQILFAFLKIYELLPKYHELSEFCIPMYCLTEVWCHIKTDLEVIFN